MRPDQYNLDGHDGYGTGFYCIVDSCPSENAYIDYVLDEHGVLVNMLVTCILCGSVTIEHVARG